MKDDEWLMFLMLVVCFGLGVGLGAWGRPPTVSPSAPPVPACMTRRAHMHEQHAVVSTWRRWTETAAAAGECRAYVLRGDEP
jgi:hypothetical protein